MEIFSISPKSFAANTYILVSKGEALVIDPAVSVSKIFELLSKLNAELRGILLTHGHFDHTATVDALRDAFSVPLMIHSGDAPMLTDGKIDGFFDFYGRLSTRRPAEKLLNDGDKIVLGDESITVASTPGHSPGSVCYVCPSKDGGYFLVTGDTLFADNIGRSDLWQGNEAELVASLKLLCRYDKSALIYPGHGVTSTLGSALEFVTYYLDF